MIGGATAHAYFRGKTLPDARTLSVLSPGYASRRSAGFAGTVSAASGLMPGCRGRSPQQNNLRVSPFPLGRGRGDGGRKEREGSVGRQQRRQALPFGTAVAGRAGNQPGKPPRRGTCTAGTTSAARVQPRGCKGRSPLHKITLISPFPLGRALCERGSGGWGQKRKRRQCKQATKKARPHRGTCMAGTTSAASGLMPGCRGR